LYREEAPFVIGDPAEWGAEVLWMKIEEVFRDLKSLLNFHELMNKRRIRMEKMVALLLIA